MKCRPDDFSSGHRHAARSRCRTRSFTLLEILVAAALTLALAGLLLGIATGALDLMHRSQGNLTANAAAKSILDLVERDLQSAIVRPDGGVWLAVDVVSDPAVLVNHGWLTTSTRAKPTGSESAQLLGDPANPDLTVARFGLSGAWVRWVTTNVETAGSLPIVVSYQIVRRPVTGAVNPANPAGARYQLYRAAVSADQTLVSGTALTVAAYQSASSQPGATRAPASVTNPASEDALASNVADFGIWLYVRAADGRLQRIFPADAADRSHAAQGGTSAPSTARYPDVADVMVRLLSEEGAALLENMETGRGPRPPQYATDDAWWWAIVTGHSQVFVRRIFVGMPPS